MFVTHDRVFLQHLTTRIVELDRGRLFDWNCDYTTFLQRKEARLIGRRGAKRQLRQKTGPGGSSGFAKGSKRAARAMKAGCARSNACAKSAVSAASKPGKSACRSRRTSAPGKLVIEAENVSYAFDDQPVVRDFSTTIQRGDKVGIIGPNGSGKTTLLRLLIGELIPQQGEIRHGTNLEIAYFDQLRAQLDENKSVLDNVGQGRDTVTINGKARNLIGYLEDFLFTRDRVRAPISALSGGERNRLLLARLFAQPANLLVLDEPTNDLDLETLELSGRPAAGLHRHAAAGQPRPGFPEQPGHQHVGAGWSGQVSETSADMTTGRNRRNNPIGPPQNRSNPFPHPLTESSTEAVSTPRKLTYKEQRALEAQQRELAELPHQIEALEAEQHRLSAAMAAPAFYQRDSAEIAQAVQQLKDLEEELSRGLPALGGTGALIICSHHKVLYLRV